MDKHFVNFGINYYHTTNLRYIPIIYCNCLLSNFDFTGNHHIIKPIKEFIEGNLSGLYLQGGFGVGKTHIAISLYRILVAKLDESSPSEIFFTTYNQIIEDIKKEKDDEITELLSECGILFLDDISTCQPKDAEILRKIISGRYEHRGRLVVTSNIRIENLKEVGLHPHAISRLQGMCSVVELKGYDRRIKNAGKF